MRQTIDHVFLDKTLNVWFDYDLEQNGLRKQFYPSNILPLILFNGSKKSKKCLSHLTYLNQLKIFEFKGKLVKLFNFKNIVII